MKLSRVLLGLLVCTTLVCGPTQTTGAPTPVPTAVPSPVPGSQPISAAKLKPYYVQFLELQTLKDNIAQLQADLDAKTADVNTRFAALCSSANVNQNDWNFDFQNGVMTRK